MRTRRRTVGPWAEPNLFTSLESGLWCFGGEELILAGVEDRGDFVFGGIGRFVEERLNRNRRGQEPYLIGKNDQVEVLVSANIERFQLATYLVRCLGEGIDEAHEGPGKGVRRHRP